MNVEEKTMNPLFYDKLHNRNEELRKSANTLRLEYDNRRNEIGRKVIINLIGRNKMDRRKDWKQCMLPAMGIRIRKCQLLNWQ